MQCSGKRTGVRENCLREKTDMKIETITRNDIPAVTDVWNESFPEAVISPESFDRQIYKDFLLDERGMFCAKEGSVVTGFSIATTVHISYAGRSPLPGCIPVVAVREKHRRKRLGTALLKKSEEYLVKQGVEKMQIGYPTYLRGTVLSILGIDTRWQGALKFFENQGYAPREAIDSMSLKIESRKIYEEVAENMEKQKGIVSGSLAPDDTDAFMKFLQNGFPDSWYEQFSHLYSKNLINCEEVLIMKQNGKIAGFAGPFHVAECGDTCGIGLGIDPELRGKGLGLALLYGIIRMVCQHGGKKITLFGAVDKINYYGKAGFVPDAVYLFMEKEIRMK